MGARPRPRVAAAIGPLAAALAAVALAGPVPAAGRARAPGGTAVRMSCRPTRSGGAGVVSGVRPWPRVTSVCVPRREPAAAVQPVMWTAVRFLGRSTGLVGGSRCPAAGTPCSGVIVRTADGGRTWRTAYHGPSPVRDLQCATPADGWALASGPRCPPVVTGCPTRILATRDGGRTWRIVGGAGAPLEAVTLATPAEA
ncbi:MAG TPA: hypothetical protein VNN74_04770 [Candidatus Micrarchaeia archaeon]|nr:hypothetical protein [Candidatus Micrarchaeia archaeon]